jgi:quercetin dioxygenase-like cupin family protein
MKALQISKIAAGLPEANLDDPKTTYDDARGATSVLGSFDRGEVTVTRFAGQSPWERHLDGEEFFFVLEGSIEFLLLPDHGGELRSAASKGDGFIVPRGCWHRTHASSGTAVIVVRGSDHGPVTFVDDPRTARADDLID